MAKFNNNQIQLLNSIAELYNLIIIIDSTGTFNPEVYVSIEYTPETNNCPYFSMKGFKCITPIVEANSVYVNNTEALKTIATQIDSLQPVNRERKYSEQFQWIKF